MNSHPPKVQCVFKPNNMSFQSQANLHEDLVEECLLSTATVMNAFKHVEGRPNRDLVKATVWVPAEGAPVMIVNPAFHLNLWVQLQPKIKAADAYL